MAGVTKVINPLTGHWITIGGPVYNDLVKKGIKISKRKKKVAKTFEVPSDYYVPTVFQDYPVVNPRDRKWGEDKPGRVNERRKILDKCGESCFLMPRAPGKPGFPICNKTLPCRYNCRGIKAAAARAGEWKYTEVLETARTIGGRLGCYK